MDHHVYTIVPSEQEGGGLLITGADSQQELGEISGGNGLQLARIVTVLSTSGDDPTIVLEVAVRGEYSPHSLTAVKTPFGRFSVEDATVKQYLPEEENTLWVWEVPAMFAAGVVEEVVISGDFLPDYEEPDEEDIYERLLTKLGDLTTFTLRKYPDTPVVLKYEQGPENWKSYVAIYPLGISPLGRQQTSTLTNLNSELHIQANYEARVQFTFVGKKAFSLANHFNQQITTPLVREELARLNLTVFAKGRDIAPTPQRRETRWVEAFSVDIRFGFAVETRQIVDTVDSATIDPQLFRG